MSERRRHRLETAAATDLDGRTAVVTGGTGGIGQAIASGLAARGATTVIIGRDRARAAAAASTLAREAGAAQVEFLTADLSVLSEVRRLAAELLERHPRIDVLVNNAGALFAQRRETADGFEATFALNHLSPFLLTQLLAPALAGAPAARIVNVNSQAHQSATGLDFDDLQSTRWKRGFPAYSRSKLANLMFTFELARRLEGTAVSVNALHPGIVDTDLLRRFVAERCFPGVPPVNALATRAVRAAAHLWLRFSTPAEAARTPIYLASAVEVAGVSGRYFDEFGDEAAANPAARVRAQWQRLWTVSANLTGLDEAATPFTDSIPGPGPAVAENFR